MGTSSTIKKLSIAVAGVAVVGLSVLSLTEKVEAFSVTVHADKAEWQNALKGQPFQTEEFNDTNLALGVSVTSQGVIKNGVWEDQVSDTQTNTWSFAQPLSAWGGNFNLAGVLDKGTGIAVTAQELLGGNNSVGEISNSLQGEFWGFVADSPVDTVRLSKGTQGNLVDDRESYFLDDMVYAQTPPAPVPEPVPEPAEIVGTLGFVGFLAFVRRKRQQNVKNIL